MRNPTFCICENKDADQLRGPRTDQRHCFRYIDRTIPLLSKSEISSLYQSSVGEKPGSCRTRSETRKLVFHDAAYIYGLDYLMRSLQALHYKRRPPRGRVGKVAVF